MVSIGCDTLIAIAIVLDVVGCVRVEAAVRSRGIRAVSRLLLRRSSIRGQWQGVEFLAETSKIVDPPTSGARDFGAMTLAPNKDLTSRRGSRRQPGELRS